jgi:sulfur-carrier protein
LLTLDISYFAWVRERMGRGGERVVLPETVTTARDLIDWLAARDAAGSAAFAEPTRIRVAIDGVMTAADGNLRDKSEVSLFPPVTGG